MQIIYDHTHGFGKMRNQVYIYVPIGALVKENEHRQALETGWCPLDKNLWFQTRSTRINVCRYNPDKKLIKKANKIKYFFDISINDYKKQKFLEIYKKYLTYKNFHNSDLTFEDIIKNSNGHLYYVYESNIIGFCFFKVLANSIFAVEFAWDYENKSISLGKLNIHFLCMYAKMKKYDNVYLSSGYESCSLYKSDYSGFQWWTGITWSDDVEHYHRLCYSDDEVKIKFNWETL